MNSLPNSKKMIKDLQLQAKKLEEEMKYEFHTLKRSSSRMLGITLTAAAGGLLATLVFKALSHEEDEQEEVLVIPEKEVKKAQVQEKSVVKSRIKAAVVALLIAGAKKKLTDILNKKADDSEPSE